jgi:hypothetical protein
MLKQSLKLIGILIVLAALLPLTGCEQAAGSGDTVFAGRHSVHGTVSPAELQAAVDNARTAGEPLIFVAEGATISAGPYLVDFTGVAVRIEGPVITSGTAVANRVILDASRAASLTLVDDGKLTLTSYDYLIYANGMDLDLAGPNVQKVLYTPDLADITGSVINVAVDEFLVKSTVNTDIPAGVTNLFVIKKASILPEGVALSGANIYALGDVELLGDDTDVIATAGPKFFLTSSSRLVNGTNGHVSVTLPSAALTIAEIDVGGPVTGGPTTGITLLGIADGLTITKLTGTGGPLTLPKNIPVTINGGDGDVAIGDGTGAITFTGAVVNKSTGKTTFNAGANPTTFAASTATPPVTADITGPAEFTGNVTTAATGHLNFGNKVILPDAGVITLTAAVNLVNLGKGASIVVKDGDDEIPLLKAAADTVLTPEAGLTLTVDATDREIVQGTKVLTITSGELAVVPDASFVLPGGTTAGTLTVAAGSVLSFESDHDETAPKIGKLVLTGGATTTGAILKGAGKVIAGGAEITGGTSGSWQATTASETITLSYNGILASAATIAFTAIADGAAITVPAGVTLKIPADTKIDLKNDISGSTIVGTITLKAGGEKGAGGKIAFTSSTSVIKAGDETATAVASPAGAFVAPEGAASGKITVSNFSNVKIFSGDSATGKLDSITGTSGTDEYIQAFDGEGADGVINQTPVS